MSVPFASRMASDRSQSIAKKMPEYAGVCVWDDLPAGDQQRLLQYLPVSEVWGVGRQWTTHLQIGIQTV